MTQYVRPGDSAGTNQDVILIAAPSPGSISGINPVIVGGPTAQTLAYTHVQGTSSAVWVVTHNLGWHPNVTVQDSGGSIVEGEIAYTNTNSLTITFTGAFSGKAYLS
jgi:hypothetical protein